MPKIKNALVLAYDLGGTKVRVGVVNAGGKILTDEREAVPLKSGKDAVIELLAKMGQKQLQKHPEIQAVGIASAGPLDPLSGRLLDPTNLTTNGKSWGVIPLTKILEKRLKRSVFLENDAAAAVLAERWVGSAKKIDNVIVLTLGTGLGTGIVCNGELVRAGRGQHPEGGHLILRAGDRSAPCGCGNFGCAEALLSGAHFENRAGGVNAKELSALARKKNPRAVKLFLEYSENLAIAIHNYCVIYAPELVVLTGSFAEASDLFLKPAQKILLKMMARRRKGVDLMPKLSVSSLHNRAGLLGGAFVAFNHLKAID